MKTTSLLAALLITFAGVSFGFASDQAKPGDSANAQPEKSKLTANKSGAQDTRVAMTGSYIKKEIRRSGQITDGASPLLVIDSKSIRNSGASDLRQLLVRQGVNH